jgi:hypothetical protein
VRRRSSSKPTHFGVPPGVEELSNAGPQVYVVYESEAERDELLSRLRRAGLCELPQVLVDLGPAEAPGSPLERMRSSLVTISKGSEAGAGAALGFLRPRWALVAALALILGPLIFVSRLALRPPRTVSAQAQ